MKQALVTGASEGIGRTFVRRLAAEGYAVTGVARTESRLEELIGRLGGAPHSYVTADLSTPSGIERTAERLSDGHYTLLVNNAAIGLFRRFAATSRAKQQEMIRLNCEAVATLSRAFLTEAQSGDALINVSSTLAVAPMPGCGLYAASKAFVSSLTQSLWYEQKSKGVYVMELCPGSTDTKMHRRAGGTDEERPPDFLVQPPEEVVEKALKALRRRERPLVVSGLHNRIFTLLSRLLPRRLLVMLMGFIRRP